MRFRRHPRHDNLQINLAPLIDTMFLLLIFFLMTTTFNQQSQLNIELPTAKGEKTEQTPVIRIIVTADGEYAINDWDHGLINNQIDTLTQALKEAAAGQEDPPLLISADEQAPHYAVIRAMEAVRNLGFTRLGFEAQEQPQ